MGAEYMCYRRLVICVQLPRFYVTVVLVAALYYDIAPMALDDSHTEASFVNLGECGYQFSQAVLVRSVRVWVRLRVRVWVGCGSNVCYSEQYFSALRQ